MNYNGILVTTDFLIIGAGPAGSAAGISLMQAGRDCIVVDKARFPRVETLRRAVHGQVAACVGRTVWERQV